MNMKHVTCWLEVGRFLRCDWWGHQAKRAQGSPKKVSHLPSTLYGKNVQLECVYSEKCDSIFVIKTAEQKRLVACCPAGRNTTPTRTNSFTLYISDCQKYTRCSKSHCKAPATQYFSTKTTKPHDKVNLDYNDILLQAISHHYILATNIRHSIVAQ